MLLVDYYHLLGDNRAAVEESPEDFKRFYEGMSMMPEDTESLVNGVKKINGFIKELREKIENDEIYSQIDNLKDFTDDAIEELKKKAMELQEKWNLYLMVSMASLDLAEIRHKYEDRVIEYYREMWWEEYKKDLYVSRDTLKFGQRKEQREYAKRKIDSLFDSIWDSERKEISEKTIKRAEIVFTIEIRIAKEKEDALRKAVGYIRRGFALYLKALSLKECEHEYERAFNDYTKAKEEILKCKLNNPKEEKFLEWLSIFLDILKGDLYYSLSNYEGAFDYYCKAMREWKDAKNNEFDRSLILAEAMVQKSKIFFEKGKFRDSMLWAFKAMKILLNYLNYETRIGEVAEVIEYLEKNKDKEDRVEKIELIKKLTPKGEKLKPCSFLLASSLKPVGILASRVFTQIGFVGLTLKLDLLKKSRYEDCDRKYCADLVTIMSGQDLVCHWLYSATELDRHNGFASYGFNLYLLRHWERLEKENSELLNKAKEKAFKATFERGIIERRFAVAALDKLRGQEDSKLRDLGRYFIMDIDKFMIPKEIYKYLNKKRVIDRMGDRFIILKRWSSYSPRVPRPRIFQCKGGGYFLIWKKKGIVIDPGFDFLINLYNEGFSLSDIDAVILTHAHIDHLDDFLALLSLITEQRSTQAKIEKKIREGIDLFLNPSTFLNYTRWISTLESASKEISIKSIHPLPVNATIDIKEYHLKIKTVKAEHVAEELGGTGEYSVGIILELMENENCEALRIGITSDTACYENIGTQYQDCNILVAHLGHARFADISQAINIEFEKDDEICEYVDDMEEHDKRRFLLALGYKFEPEEEVGHELLCQQKNERIDSKYHLRWTGTRKLFDSFIIDSFIKGAQEEKLFIISEWGEEQKAYRNKFALFLNNQLKDKIKKRCFTGDIGLTIGLGLKPESLLSIQCLKCKQDNDIPSIEIFHPLKDIKEICIKQEDEGVIYVCKGHDSKSAEQSEITKGIKPEDVKVEFIERVEKFKVI